MTTDTPPPLPALLDAALTRFAGPTGAAGIIARMRPADELMRVACLENMKASRLSFADLLLRKMTAGGWSIRRLSASCDAEGAAKFVYRIDAEGHAFTYIARAYPWDGVEKVGRRSDGANRDMFGALFLNLADETRIAKEFATFDMKAEGEMRTDADVMGWTPANRSSRHFDQVVDALAAGRQPDMADVGYLMRNGGFQASGRNGSVSFQGIPEGHPLGHPFFPDLFAIYLVRLVSIDLANAVARTRNPHAARLDPARARLLGIGNSSGQGMCVALQRWPNWVASWVSVRELSLAYAKSRPVDEAGRATMRASLARARKIYARTEPQSEDYVAPNEAIVADLEAIEGWLDAAEGEWQDLADRVAARFGGETREEFNSLLIDTVPEFCDAVAPYLAAEAAAVRRIDPRMRVGDLRALLARNYRWALMADRTLAATHQHFWYHSVDNGEQRRGERIVDPHEHFESFIDHIGAVQRLAAALTCYPDAARAGDVVLDRPDLHFAISRVQFMAGRPYAEIRDSLADRDFMPSSLIRFFLASLGIRSTTPLSIRYVRGTFYQDAPLPDDLAPKAEGDAMREAAQ